MKSKKKLKREWRRRRRKMGRSFCVVYGLWDQDGAVRYIGQTRLRPEDRLAWYYRGINQKRSRNQRLSPVERWLDHLAMFEIIPTLVVIDANATWNISEVIYIDRYRQAGYDLLNVTRGGIDGIGNIFREQEKQAEQQLQMPRRRE